MTWQIPGNAAPNTGSRARDHLANERTYLAWLRTGISVAALGVAVAKFAPQRGAHAIASGGILIFAGLLLSVYGTLRYKPSGGNWTLASSRLSVSSRPLLSSFSSPLSLAWS